MFIPTGSGDTGWESGFPNGTCYTSALSVSARRRGKDATLWRSTAITARASLLSGQRVLEDPLKQATETAKKGKEGVWSADTYVCAPLHSDTNSYFDFKLESDMVEDRLRHHFDYYLGKTEIVIYSVLAVLLAVTAFVTIATAGQILWIGLSRWTVAAQTLRVLNQLLIVLMLVEILHTVRISIRSHVLVTEPFLIVGLIASIRRVLVITLEAAALMKEGAWATEGSSANFHSSMIELGLLGLLILVLVVSITLLRRYAPASKDLSEL
jgi:Phosphate-starvation-inducible E family